MGKEYQREVLILGQVPSLGPIILFDDLEGLFKWTGAGTGTETVEKSTTFAYNGSASCHIKTTTVGAAADDYVQAYRDCFQRPGKRYEFEALFNVVTFGNCKYTSFNIEILDGTYLHGIELRYDSVNDKWEYKNSAGSYTDVPGGSQNLFGTGWHRFSIRFDESSGKYIKFTCDSLEVDLTGVGYYKTASGEAVRLTVFVKIVSVAASPPELWFDDVLLREI